MYSISTSTDSELDAVEAVEAIDVAGLFFLQGTGDADETSLR